jgi:hypothetical protein
MNEGTPLRDEGLGRVESHNEEWMDIMRRVAVEIANARGTVCADDLRAWADEHGEHPLHPNAWGAIFRKPYWRPVGYRPSTYKSNHARTIRVWARSEDAGSQTYNPPG